MQSNTKSMLNQPGRNPWTGAWSKKFAISKTIKKFYSKMIVYI